jgi:tetratricopeptide (TPR) repeat protein
MLVVPQEADVVLVYGHTTIGKAGMLVSWLSLVALLILIWRDVRPTRVAVPPESLRPWPRDGLAVLWPLALAGLGMWLYLHNPEQTYTDAWQLMRSNHWVEAADEFDRAYAARRSDAKKEEALFWAAKANEQAGRPDAALSRYRELSARYHGFWLPETLHAQWRLARDSGAKAEAQAARERLLAEFPNNRWAQSLPLE